MAFQGDSNQENAQQQTKAPRQPRQPQQQQSFAEDSFSFFTMGELSGAPMGRTPAAEVLTKLSDAMSKVYAAENKMYEVKLVSLDMANNPELPISVLIVTATSQEYRKIGVGAYALILEGSTEPFASKYEVIGGDNVEIRRFAGDAYDDNMRRHIERAAADQWPGANIINCDAVVIPRGLDIENEDICHKIAAGSLFAIHTNLRSLSTSGKDLNLKNARNDSSLNVQLSFGNPNTANSVGMPVRSDVVISTVATRTGAQASGMAERQNVVAKATGYLDVVWNPVAPQQTFFGQPQGPVATQKYMPHFIITSLDCPALTTLQAQLFALATTPVLAENHAWAKGFDRKVGGQTIGGLDISDIGALGIEANLENNQTGYGARVDLKADQYRGDNFYRFMALLFRQDLLISMDVEDIGPDTWTKLPFLSACHSQRAAQVLLQAADNLTGGEFGNIYRSMGGNGQPVTETGDMIHMGYVEDNNGRRDIREIDHIAVANILGDRDPGQIINWSNSFFAKNINVNKRISDRAKIIGFCEGGNVVFTGKAHRITFDPVFLAALCTAISRAGTTLKQQVTDVGFGMTDRAIGLTGLGMNSASTGLYQQGSTFVGSAGFSNYGNRFSW